MHHSSDNYSALTRCIIITKLYIAIIVKHQTGVFEISHLKCVGKDGLSKKNCTFMVIETYYVNNGSTVNMLLFDVSKAFGRVN